MDHESPFRDPVAGAMARRRELLSRRRDEVVDMPDSVRRIYVARASRIGGGAAAACAGGFFLALVVLGHVFGATGSALDEAALLVPGPRSTLLATLAAGAWIAGGFGWLLARARAERSFARLTSGAARPSDDVYADIERLAHVTPASVGQSSAHRLEGASVGLPLFALALLLPPAAIYFALAMDAGGYATAAALEDAVLASAAELAMLAGGAATMGVALHISLRRWQTSSLPTAAGAIAALGALVSVAVAIVAGIGTALVPAGLTFAGTGVLLQAHIERIELGLGDSCNAAFDDSDRRPWKARATRMCFPLLLGVATLLGGMAGFWLMASRIVLIAPPAPRAVDSLEPALLAELAAGAETSLAPDDSDASGVMVFRVVAGGPGEARWRALTVAPSTDPTIGWFVRVDARLLEGNGVPARSVTLSPFPDTAPELPHAWPHDAGGEWSFVGSCSPAPIIEWHAAARSTETGPFEARLVWSATLQPCSLPASF
jgi:hypothetical protein